MNIVIKGGKIVNHNGIFVGDILIKNEKIEKVNKNLHYKVTNIKTYDARNCFVLPGLVDPHVHMGFCSGEFISSDTFETGSRGAAFGGVTTIIDFAVPTKDEPLDLALERRLKEASGQCNVDYHIHVAITQLRETLPEEIDRCIEYGVSAFRLYMVYPGLGLDLEKLYVIFNMLQKKNCIVRIHAENYEFIKAREEELIKSKLTSPYYHYVSRPEFVEEAAVATILILQRETKCPVYFNHLSTKASLELIKIAKRNNQKVFAEVCLPYLFFTNKEYKKPNGFLYLASPSFKKEKDKNALWKGLFTGVVDTIGTDHCPFTTEQKKRYSKDFRFVPNGLPGVENTLPILFTEWVKRKRPLEKLVELVSYNPSRIFGLYPQKGSIQPGADADIVILNPEIEWEVTPHKLHMNVDWTPYDGFKCLGKISTVILRGRVLIENGEWVGPSGLGQFIQSLQKTRMIRRSKSVRR